MADVFISYSKKDFGRIDALIKALEGEDLSVFWDHKIPPSSNYFMHIASRLDSAACVIVVWSSNALASRFVMSEAEAGWSREVLVPVFIEDVRVPVPFNTVQGAHLIDWDGDLEDLQWRGLLAVVKEYVEGGESHGEQPHPPPPPSPKPDTLPLSPGARVLLEEADDAKRGTHPYLGLHHWVIALLDKHPGMVERIRKGIDCFAVAKEVRRRIREEEDFGEPMPEEAVVERANAVALARDAEQIWERDVATVILEACAGSIDL
jgi:hypothetical protein